MVEAWLQLILLAAQFLMLAVLSNLCVPLGSPFFRPPFVWSPVLTACLFYMTPSVTTLMQRSRSPASPDKPGKSLQRFIMSQEGFTVMLLSTRARAWHMAWDGHRLKEAPSC